jgi:hypothetical protein
MAPLRTREDPIASLCDRAIPRAYLLDAFAIDAYFQIMSSTWNKSDALSSRRPPPPKGQTSIERNRRSTWNIPPPESHKLEAFHNQSLGVVSGETFLS